MSLPASSGSLSAHAQAYVPFGSGATTTPLRTALSSRASAFVPRTGRVAAVQPPPPPMPPMAAAPPIAPPTWAPGWPPPQQAPPAYGAPGYVENSSFDRYADGSGMFNQIGGGFNMNATAPEFQMQAGAPEFQMHPPGPEFSMPTFPVAQEWQFAPQDQGGGDNGFNPVPLQPVQGLPMQPPMQALQPPMQQDPMPQPMHEDLMPQRMQQEHMANPWSAQPGLQSCASSQGFMEEEPRHRGVDNRIEVIKEADAECGVQSSDSEDTPSTQATQGEHHCRESRQSSSVACSESHCEDEDWDDAETPRPISVQALLQYRSVALDGLRSKIKINCCVAMDADMKDVKGGRTPQRSEKSEKGTWHDAPRLKVAPTLEASPTSWTAAQQAHRDLKGGKSPAMVDVNDEDAEVTRSIRAILNKLTVERFEALYGQLVDSGICKAQHVEVLMREVFEKATTQHHFIPMYAELCFRLNEWFVGNQGSSEDGRAFKRILLNRCQLSFEETLKQQHPSLYSELPPEERAEAELKQKTRTLGNLKLVGALLEKGMLASRILLAVVDELIGEPTSAALECLAVFLTAVGPTFDRPEWVHHSQLCATFQEVQHHRKRSEISARTRCLLQDVLDLRASNWENMKKAVRAEATPTTLENVHKQAKEEKACTPSHGQFENPRRKDLCGSATPQAPRSPAAVRKAPLNAFGMKNLPAPPAPPPASKQAKAFDAAAFQEDAAKVFSIMARCGDSKEALDKIAAHSVPPEHQAAELVTLFAHVAESGRASGRRAGFKLLGDLFVHGIWERGALSDGLGQFFGEQFYDLQLDLPMLPKICNEDLKPVLQGLVDEKKLQKKWIAVLEATTQAAMS